MGWISGSSVFLACLMFLVLAVALVIFRPLINSGELPQWAVGLLVGGASSNIADRVARGSVVDYLEIRSFVFNFADVAIVVGALVAFNVGQSARRRRMSLRYDALTAESALTESGEVADGC